MRHPLTTILAVVSVTSALWFLTLAQLSGPTVYTSIPDHSTRTQFPGPLRTPQPQPCPFTLSPPAGVSRLVTSTVAASDKRPKDQRLIG